MTATTQLAPGLTKRSSANFVDPRAITRRPGFNPRFDFGEITDLAKSIKANGILQDIRVKRIPARDMGDGVVHHFEIVDGDRRMTAIEHILAAGETWPGAEDGVPVKLVDKAQDDVTSLIQMFETNSGLAFKPLEEAEAFKRMVDAGMTITQIAERTHCSAIHISNGLKLLEADDSVKAAVASGVVATTTAKAIVNAAKGDKAKQRELVQAASAAKGDKKAKRKVKVQIQAQRVEQAAKNGRALKIRALTDDQLSELGATMAKTLDGFLLDAGCTVEALTAKVGASDLMAAAFSFGALQALKAAAGLKVKLTV